MERRLRIRFDEFVECFLAGFSAEPIVGKYEVGRMTLKK